MPTLALLLAMQFVVSVKAGLVNHVQGVANVGEMDMVRKGQPILTALDGYAEILLTPGSFLRVGENSEVVLDGVEIEDVRVRVVRGEAVVEVLEINKKYPLHVQTGELKVDIPKSGIYRFSEGSATVIQGKLQTAAKTSYEKGWQVMFGGGLSARKIGKFPLTSIDVYSQARSEEIARANMSMASRVQRVSGASSFWLYEPYLGMYTFMPLGNFRSPYGYRYYAPGRAANFYVNNNNNNGNNGGSSSGSMPNFTPSAPTGNAGNPNTGNTGGNAGGISSPTIEREQTVSTPAERMAPAAQVESAPLPAREQ